MRDDGAFSGKGSGASPWRRGPGEDAWHRLSPGTRRACLGLLRQRLSLAAPLVFEVAPDVRAELEREGFLEPSRAQGARWVSTDDIPVASLELLAWLAVLESGALLSPSPLLGLELGTLYGSEDSPEADELVRRVITRGGFRPTIAGSPRAFLESAPHSARWIEWASPPAMRTPAEARLVAALTVAGGTLPASELPQIVTDRAALDEARESLARHLVIFHDLDRESLEVEVGFLASVRLSLDRRRRFAPVPVATPLARFEAALLHDDATALLREPGRRLERLPSWVERALSADEGSRERAARALLEGQRFLDGREPRSEGRAFLGLPREERVQKVLRAASREPGEPHGPDLSCFGVAASAVQVAWQREPRGPSPRDAQRLREHVARAFARLEPGRYHLLEPFLAHACDGDRAPLLVGAEPFRVSATLHGRAVAPYAESLELASRVLVREVIERLVVLGGASLGLVGGEVAFALADAGRFLLGLAPSLGSLPGQLAPAARIDERGQVLLERASPSAVAELRLVAEEREGTTFPARRFQVTRESVLGAVAAGIPESAIVQTLERLSVGPVPARLLEDVRRWAESVRPVVLARELVIECPDETTLERVRSGLGLGAAELRHALRISVPSGESAAAVASRLSALGIVTRERAAAAPQGGGP